MVRLRFRCLILVAFVTFWNVSGGSYTYSNSYSKSRRKQSQSYTPYGQYIAKSRKYSNKHVNPSRSIHRSTDVSGSTYRSKSAGKCLRGERGPPGRPGRDGQNGVCPTDCHQPARSIYFPTVTQAPVTPQKRDSPQREGVKLAGFAVALSGNAFSAIGRVVLFDTFITDETNNFDFDTGAFTAKITGLYQFSASGTQSNNRKPLHFAMKRGYMKSEQQDDFLCSAQSNGKYQTCSCQSVVKLEVGQKVYVKLIKGDLFANDYHYSTFSGFQIN